MRTRWMLVGVAASVMLAATSTPGSVAADDPCGDIIYAEAAGERVTGQPDAWSSFDVMHLAIAEVGERDEGTYAIRLTLELCGEAVDPATSGHPFQVYRIEWSTGDGCSRGVQIGSDEQSVAVVGELGAQTPDHRNVFEVCPDLDAAGIARTDEYTMLAEIPDGALVIDGSRIEVTLRPEALPGFGTSFAPGTVWGGPSVQTRAAVPTAGGSVCLPGDGPAGTVCGAARDGDRLDLPDLVLTDR